MSLPEFMLSDYFKGVRRHKRRFQWCERELWMAVALAAYRRAMKTPPVKLHAPDRAPPQAGEKLSATPLMQ